MSAAADALMGIFGFKRVEGEDMKTDRELLELAARAAFPDCTHLSYPLDWVWDCVGEWDPLTADGDALRLAVKLNIDVLTPIDDQDNASTILPSGETGPCIPVRSDHYAATRRAIVRAAAAIGEASK